MLSWHIVHGLFACGLQVPNDASAPWHKARRTPVGLTDRASALCAAWHRVCRRALCDRQDTWSHPQSQPSTTPNHLRQGISAFGGLLLLVKSCHVDIEGISGGCLLATHLAGVSEVSRVVDRLHMVPHIAARLVRKVRTLQADMLGTRWIKDYKLQEGGGVECSA